MIRRSEGMQWAMLTALGLVAGLAIALPLGVPIFAVVGATAGTPLVLGIVGLVLGGAQWPVIRRHSRSSGWWILASTVGMAIGLTAGVVTVEQIGRAVLGGRINFRMLHPATRALSFAAIGMIGGTSLGLAQWLVLRRMMVDCKRWAIANGASLSTGLACGSLAADAVTKGMGSLEGIGLMLLVGSVAMGGVTSGLLRPLFTAMDLWFRSPERELDLAIIEPPNQWRTQALLGRCRRLSICRLYHLVSEFLEGGFAFPAQIAD